MRNAVKKHILKCGFSDTDRKNEQMEYRCPYDSNCDWVLNDSLDNVKAKLLYHCREYHPNLLDQPVAVSGNDGTTVWACGYAQCSYTRRQGKDDKREMRNHMKSCGYDDMTNLEFRKNAFDGLGICPHSDCQWVAKAKGGKFGTLQGIKSALTNHRVKEHGENM